MTLCLTLNLSVTFPFVEMKPNNHSAATMSKNGSDKDLKKTESGENDSHSSTSRVRGAGYIFYLQHRILYRMDAIIRSIGNKSHKCSHTMYNNNVIKYIFKMYKKN